VATALALDTQVLREKRSGAMESETWEARVAEIDRTATRAIRRRQTPSTGRN
jgi:hypothetical protein